MLWHADTEAHEASPKPHHATVRFTDLRRSPGLKTAAVGQLGRVGQSLPGDWFMFERWAELPWYCECAWLWPEGNAVVRMWNADRQCFDGRSNYKMTLPADMLVRFIRLVRK